jgi:nitroreductase
MKKLTVISLFFAVFLLNASAQDNKALVALNHYAARNFIAGALTQTELDTVIQSGIRAPSAANRQGWHFTVIRNQNLAKKIVSDIADGNVIIVVSAAGAKVSERDILDCGLAAESMYLTAQAIGLGSRIYTGPIDNINKNLKGELDLPAGYSAVVFVRIGKVRPVDAGSAASSRKAPTELVTYKN